MSNKFTSNRHYLIRPKVCKAAPKLAQVAGSYQPTAELDPYEWTVLEDSSINGSLFATLECVNPGSPITVGIATTGGIFVLDAPLLNGSTIGWEYFSPAPGTYYVLLGLTWQNGAFTSLTGIAHSVLNPPED